MVEYTYRFCHLFNKCINDRVAELFIVQGKTHEIHVGKTHPLAITMNLIETIVGVILVSLGVVAEDLACVQEEAVDLKILRKVVDQIDRPLLNHVLTSLFFENRTSRCGE